MQHIYDQTLLLPLIGLRAFDLVLSPVWWEAATNILLLPSNLKTK